MKRFDKWLLDNVKQEFDINFPTRVTSSSETNHQDETEGLLTSLNQVGSNVAFDLTKFPAFPLVSKLQILWECLFSFPIWICILIAMHSIGKPEFTACQSKLMYFLHFYIVVFLLISITSCCIKVIKEYVQFFSTSGSLRVIHGFCLIMKCMTFLFFLIVLNIIDHSNNCYAQINGSEVTIRSKSSIMLDLMLQIVILLGARFVICIIIHSFLPNTDTILSLNTSKVRHTVEEYKPSLVIRPMPLPSHTFSFSANTSASPSSNNITKDIPSNMISSVSLSEQYTDKEIAIQDDICSIQIPFQLSSSRVKAISFHPEHTWMILAFHCGVMEIWDYEVSRKEMTCTGHDGPVRAIAFHPILPHFVSGSDDLSLRVWNYSLRCCHGTFLGHLDYIRSVQYHPTLPLFLSASDDGTIRIWHAEADQQDCLCTVAGHVHYVMQAMFHPHLPYILSTSLDQSIRIWDYSTLKEMMVNQQAEKEMQVLYSSQARRKANTTPATPTPASSIWICFPASVSFVTLILTHVNAHTKGINAIAWHPREDCLLISMADDHILRQWYFDPSQKTLICIGNINCHNDNITSGLFHSSIQELILSTSEDKTFRITSVKAKKTVYEVKLGDDNRGWCVMNHPKIPYLYALGTDHGVIVFDIHQMDHPHVMSTH